MTRTEAARILGLPVDATPEAVQAVSLHAARTVVAAHQAMSEPFDPSTLAVGREVRAEMVRRMRPSYRRMLAREALSVVDHGLWRTLFGPRRQATGSGLREIGPGR